MTQGANIASLTPAQLRALCRAGQFTGPTAGASRGYAQANLVIIPKAASEDFRQFCQLNPKPCPLLEVTSPGNPHLKLLAQDADLRTDLPRYRVFIDGKLTDEPTDLLRHWRADLVAFLLGCSFTFENALAAAQLPLRHWEERRPDGQTKNVPMYITNIPCRSAGLFRGELVVSMRPMRIDQANLATRITFDYPLHHGAPVHQGDPAAIGITDINTPDFGDAVTIHADEIPLFWACGVTPQVALAHADLPLAITHAPGHMFVTDRTEASFRSTD